MPKGAKNDHMKKRLQRVFVCGLLCALLAASVPAPASAAGFDDVPAGHWAADAIDRAVDLGLVRRVGAEVQQDAVVPLPAAAAGEQKEEGNSQGEKGPSHRGSPPSSGVSQGKPTVNTLPSGSRRWAVTQPPWRRTVSRTMDRPRPVPPAARERALSTR